MARIWYSVHGEGWGHAIRSTAVIEELATRHTLLLSASGKAYPYLAARFPQLPAFEIFGLNIVYRDNRVIISKTLKDALDRLPDKVRFNLRVLFGQIVEFNPDVILSDFEPFSNYAAPLLRRPLITINNISLLTKAKIRVPARLWGQYVRTAAVIRLLEGNGNCHLIPSFVKVRLRTRRAVLVPPILRAEVLGATPTRGDHILVYQTSKTYGALLRVLRSHPKSRFACYNLGRVGAAGNLTFKPFSDAGFIADLASAKAVITNGGFTLISEALHLGKPVLSIPIAGQLEQFVNARLLETAGLGMACPRINRAALSAFVDLLPGFEARLARYPRQDNAHFFRILERAIRTTKPSRVSRGMSRALLPLVRSMARRSAKVRTR